MRREISQADYFNALSVQAKASLLNYTLTCEPKYAPSKIHRCLARVGELIVGGKLKRVIITMPRRHGKSKLMSENLASWFISTNPGKEAIVTAYAQSRSDKISLAVRDRLETKLNMAMFPECRINPDTRRIDDWMTTSGGGMLSAGIGGPIVGRGADLLIIDDPIKNREDAESLAARDKVWDWYLSAAYPALSPTGVVVIIMTRWHPDDLVGRITDPKRKAEMKDMGIEDEEFTVFKFPALCKKDGDILSRKKGEALWPERWNEKKLAAIKYTIGSYEWMSQYECEPQRRQGNYINRDWFNEVEPEDVPKGLRWVRFWDLAASTEKRSDFTASPKMAKDAKGNIYIDAMENFQKEWPEVKKRICAVNYLDMGKCAIGVEQTGGWKVAVAEIKAALLGKAIVRGYPVEKDKLTRALRWIALAEAGKVFIVKRPWRFAFYTQCEQFPSGAHDDMVDGVSGGHFMLTTGVGSVLA